MWQIVPSRPSRRCDMVLWNISGAERMQNRRRLKQNRLIGVMEVVSFRDSLSKGICQKPELASNFVKIALSRSFAFFRPR